MDDSDCFETALPGILFVQSSFVVPPYLIVTLPEVRVSFVRSLVTNPTPPTESAALLAEAWVTSAGIFTPLPPKALLGHPAILHIPADLTDSYITAIHQVEGISVP